MRNFFICAVCLFCFFSACNTGNNTVKNDTYYIEVLNCPDSIRDNLINSFSGKVAFTRYNKRELISVNYVTENYPNMHYFRSATELGTDIPEGTVKIQVGIQGNYHIDSTFYNMPKFRYTNGKWVKFSDIGFIKAATRGERFSTSTAIDLAALYREISLMVAFSTYD